MTLTCSIVEGTDRFYSILEERLRDQKMIRMKELTDNLTMDIIGRVVL